MGSDELRDATHHTHELYGVPFMFPTCGRARWSRSCRWRAPSRARRSSRCIAAFPPARGPVTAPPARADLAHALNRISSALYLLAVRYVAGPVPGKPPPARPGPRLETAGRKRTNAERAHRREADPPRQAVRRRDPPRVRRALRRAAAAPVPLAGAGARSSRSAAPPARSRASWRARLARDEPPDRLRRPPRPSSRSAPPASRPRPPLTPPYFQRRPGGAPRRRRGRRLSSRTWPSPPPPTRAAPRGAGARAGAGRHALDHAPLRGSWAEFLDLFRDVLRESGRAKPGGPRSLRGGAPRRRRRVRCWSRRA